MDPHESLQGILCKLYALVDNLDQYQWDTTLGLSFVYDNHIVLGDKTVEEWTDWYDNLPPKQQRHLTSPTPDNYDDDESCKPGDERRRLYLLWRRRHRILEAFSYGLSVHRENAGKQFNVQLQVKQYGIDWPHKSWNLGHYEQNAEIVGSRKSIHVLDTNLYFTLEEFRPVLCQLMACLNPKDPWNRIIDRLMKEFLRYEYSPFDFEVETRVESKKCIARFFNNTNGDLVNYIYSFLYIVKSNKRKLDQVYTYNEPKEESKESNESKEENESDDDNSSSSSWKRDSDDSSHSSSASSASDDDNE